MTAQLKKLSQFVDRNFPLVVSIAVAAAIIVFGAGCESTTKSPTTGQAVTSEGLQADADAFAAEHQAKTENVIAGLEGELEQIAKKIDQAKRTAAAEVVAMNAKLHAAQADLARQDEWKQLAFTTVKTAVDSLGGPYAGMIGSLVVTAGSMWNSRRKNLVIASLKPKAPSA